SRRRHTRCLSDWSSDVCSSDLQQIATHSSASAFPRQGEVHCLHECSEPFCRPNLHTRQRLAVRVLSSNAPGHKRARSLHSTRIRSEERRVGKECRTGWAQGLTK